MIDLNREQFEKLPVVAGILSNHVFWHDECEQYQASDDDTLDNADWLNGAWYMYKEQQKKLDCCREENKAHLEKIDELQARVDKVVHILTYTNHASTPLCNELRDILKGNKDEN